MAGEGDWEEPGPHGTLDLVVGMVDMDFVVWELALLHRLQTLQHR